MGLDLTECMYHLKKVGIRVESENQTILEIAVKNKLTPKHVYINMQSDDTGATENIKKLPVNPEPGIGRKTLSDVSEEYGFELNIVLEKLSESNITATGDMTFKEITEQNKKNPMDIYNILKNFSSSVSKK